MPEGRAGSIPHALLDSIGGAILMLILTIARTPQVFESFRTALQPGGHAFLFASGADDAWDTASDRSQHLTVIHDEAPFHAATFVRALRRSGFIQPILIVTHGNDTPARIEAFAAGADQVCPADVAAEEFVARANAMFRQCDPTPADELRYRDLSLDLVRVRVTRGDDVLTLSGKALALLEYLLRHPEKLVDRATLGSAVWGADFDPASNSFEVTLSKLRAQVDRGYETRYIHTVSGRGYLLTDRPSTPRP